MLNEKELLIYKTIYKFINKNNYSPSIRELCNLLNIKSTKTICKYLKTLMEKNFINYHQQKKRTIMINKNINNKINVINTKKIIEINFNSNHLLYQIKNNYFKNYNIKKNDYLIINIEKKIKDNDLGLFIINDKYRIMKYMYLDGYYILEDNTKEVLNKINLVGIVESVYRNKI